MNRPGARAGAVTLPARAPGAYGHVSGLPGPRPPRPRRRCRRSRSRRRPGARSGRRSRPGPRGDGQRVGLADGLIALVKPPQQLGLLNGQVHQQRAPAGRLNGLLPRVAILAQPQAAGTRQPPGLSRFGGRPLLLQTTPQTDHVGHGLRQFCLCQSRRWETPDLRSHRALRPTARAEDRRLPDAEVGGNRPALTGPAGAEAEARRAGFARHGAFDGPGRHRRSPAAPHRRARHDPHLYPGAFLICVHTPTAPWAGIRPTMPTSRSWPTASPWPAATPHSHPLTTGP